MCINNGKVGLRIKWLGCACFEMNLGDFTVVNDPWITDNAKTDLTWEAIEKCDIITVTHTHYDHITDIPKLIEKFDPVLLCGDLTALAILQYTDMCPMRLYPMSANLELDFDAVKIKALFGRHTVLGPTMGAIKKRLMANPLVGADPMSQQLNYMGSFEYRNFLYTLPNGVKVLIWGNELTAEQKNILRAEKPDIAILQMTKNSPEETADICIEMGSKIVLPNHIDGPNDYMHLAVALGEELAKRDPKIKYIIPEYGKWIEI